MLEDALERIEEGIEDLMIALDIDDDEYDDEEVDILIDEDGEEYEIVELEEED